MKSVGKGRLTNYLLRAKLQDLSFYYDRTKRLRSRDGVEAEARAVLKKDLENALVKANGNNLMLIAHSMGSIIGYDVLRDLDRKPRKSEEEIEFILHDFIAIGSPLGVGLVKNNVRGERSYSKPSLRTPTVVKRRWANYADRKDPVAFDSHLRDDFGANSSAVRVEDDLVTNDYTAQGDRNPHKSYGYLRTPEISMHIQQFIEAGDSNS